MIDQDAQLQDLPHYWQERVHRLRSENHELRARLHDAERFDHLSPTWQTKIAKLRRENGRFRTARNAALAELAELRAEISAGK
ncbi:hypothetical protein BH09ACT8_BH09ACT8_27140 [soil metagenome]